MKKNQKSIFEQIAKVTALNTTFEDLQIEQTPTNLQDPVRVADFATGVVGAFGANVAEIGQLRGLPKQTISVDRRLATHSVDSAMWQYINGMVIEGGEIAKEAVNSIQVAAETGDVMQIKSIAEELKSESDAVAPYCDELVRLAEDFDFDGIQKLVLALDS